MKIFDQIMMSKPRKNVFDLSHEKKLTTQMARLTPILLQEVVPGDKFTVNSEILMRMQPLVSPVMHRVDVYTHYFFVPNRILWDEWEEFITGGDDGLSALTPPTITIDETTKVDFGKGSLADYLGIPIVEDGVTIGNPLDVVSLPFRAYQEIFNEYYRDQNLQPPADITDNGQITGLKNRAWEKDYFTSCLPFAQKGEEVKLPLGGTAPVNIVNPPNGAGMKVLNKDGGEVFSGDYPLRNVSAILSDDQTGITNPAMIDPNGNLETDLSNATAATINDLRRASRLQEWLEKNARGGSRYIEQIFSHFGVKSSDARLQRPEYLGGGRQAVVISEVLASVGLESAPQGTMTGHGISIGKSNGFSRSFEEHGIIMGILSVQPRSTYSQGVPKIFTRKDKLDHYWPEFAQLGEQEVKNSELFWDYTNGLLNSQTFGYQSRYAEYKYNQSSVHGDMHDNLEFWHLGRKFATPPALNSLFISETPSQRIFAVTDPSIDQLVVQIFHKIKAVRPMPYYNVPNL